MTATQLHPDFGPRQAKHLPELHGELAVNFSVVMAIAKAGETPQSRAFYRAAIARWRVLEGSSLTKGDRELQAMQAGLAGIERKST